jgi:hypothetical protein
MTGAQFETSLPLADVPLSIFYHSEEIGLEVVIKEQISLTPSEDPDLFYGFIRPLTEVSPNDVLLSISSLEDRETRHCILDEYIQKMADERALTFSSTRGRYYQVFEKGCYNRLLDYYIGRRDDMYMFTHPKEYVPPHLKKEDSVPDGYYVYDHWFVLGYERYALSTVVDEEDLD